MASMTIDGVRRDVVVVRDGDGFVVTVGERRYAVRDVARLDDGIAFIIDHESHVAWVSNEAIGLTLSIGGSTYVQEREIVEADRPAATSRGGDGRLEAPMPGSIIAVNVSEGDRVRSGQPLVVLESMKMHNEIASPMDGVVRKVNCRVGEQVGFGHVLIEIGSEGA
jgi:biotin carboxyl carrier protein